MVNLYISTNFFVFIRAKTDHWCEQPEGLNFQNDVWKSIAIPQEMKNDSKSCSASEELQYDKCHVYDLDFLQLMQKYGNDVDKIKGSL